MKRSAPPPRRKKMRSTARAELTIALEQLRAVGLPTGAIAGIDLNKAARVSRERADQKRASSPRPRAYDAAWERAHQQRVERETLDEASRISRERAERKRPKSAPRAARPGDLVSPAMHAWAKAQRCQLGGTICDGAATTLHHVPTRGSLGVVVDVLAVATCARCHRAAHDGRIPVDAQQLAAHRTLALAARTGVLRAFLVEMLGAGAPRRRRCAPVPRAATRSTR